MVRVAVAVLQNLFFSDAATNGMCARVCLCLCFCGRVILNTTTSWTIPTRSFSELRSTRAVQLQHNTVSIGTTPANLT